MTRDDSELDQLLNPSLLLGALMSQLVAPRPCLPIVLRAVTCCVLSL